MRQRLSLLSEASLRINQSLELEKVLQDVLDTACALTSARYGAIQLHDDRGWIVDFVTFGGTPEQAEMFWVMPNAMKFQKHLEQFKTPVRIRDFHSYTRAAGLPEFRPPFPVSSVSPLMSVPILYRGRRLGTISLLEKQRQSAGASDAALTEMPDPEFSSEDEETLVMFAAQAALVIHNARVHREERQARARLETVVNTAPVGILLLDTVSKEVVSVNREVQRMIGELVSPGTSIAELFEAATYRDVSGRVISLDELPGAKALRSGEPIRAEELVIDAPDGRSVNALINVMPILDDQGEMRSVVVTALDMTPLQEVERMRSEFLGVVGHELRAPLSSIKGSAAILLETSLDPAEMVQYHQIINEQADYMRDLLSDLIDVVRIDTATLSVNPEPLDVHRLLDDTKNVFLSAGGRDNIRIKLSSDLPPIMADRKRMVQVVTNLLINASRNSHETSAIHVAATHDGVHVAISVADTGRGVGSERLPYLFEKFLRAEASDQGRDLGLGLAICKGIVEAHGGRIWAESEGPGLGSRFTFTVPVSAQAPKKPTARQAGRLQLPDLPDDSTNIRVLAVDDEPRTLKLVRDTLTNAGYEPVVTGDPRHAADLVEKAAPGVVLLDLMLPGTDGFELLTEIVANSDAPVIILSAYDQEELITRAFALGAVDYIVKPFSPNELAARVKAALRKRADSPQSYTTGELAINFAQRSVTVAGRTVDLTPIEYRLLAELASNAAVALSHDQLLKRVWGPKTTSDAGPMRTIIKNLRRKLGDQAKAPKYIITVPRIGYRMPRSHDPPPTNQ